MSLAQKIIETLGAEDHFWFTLKSNYNDHDNDRKEWVTKVFVIGKWEFDGKKTSLLSVTATISCLIFMKAGY